MPPPDNDECTSYDEVPYASFPYAQSHPDRLATVATLLGLKPPPVERYRVLELGCASGGNVIPMAEALPESSFLGIEVSERQVADGVRTVEALGLKNIELRRLDIAAVGPELGRFDYVLCHGIFSWVASPVQEHILSVCANNLTPDGIAYVSYNTFPGWHLHGITRDLLRYHTRRARSPQEKAAQARSGLALLARSVAADGGPYGAFLNSELEFLQKQSDWYVLHDLLEEENHPSYFTEFVRRAEAHGLRYVGESELRVMNPGNFRPEVAAALREMSADVLELEQYMDFLRNRTLRQTLLCHAYRVPNYEITPDRLGDLHVASPARPASLRCEPHTAGPEVFHGPSGVNISSPDPVVKAAFLALGEAWPQTIPFLRLCAHAHARLNPGVEPDPATLAADRWRLGQVLLQCHTTSAYALVEFSTRPILPVNRAGDRPLVRPLARWQTQADDFATNLRHEVVRLGVIERLLARHLDGRHDRGALLELIGDRVRRGDITPRKNGVPVTDPREVHDLLHEAVEQALMYLAGNSLLVG
jgi:SAM-dependent methyltransferase